MKILYLLFVSVVCFSLLLVGTKKFRISVLYTLAIGGAVNANFFYASAYPIKCFGLLFGIDSIIYTLFIFCIVIMLLKYNKKSAWTLSWSSIAAIMFSAVMQFVSEVAQDGLTKLNFLNFVSFIISVLATVVAVFCMITVIVWLKEKKLNVYYNIIIGVVVATITNSIIYYGLNTLLSGGLQDFFWNYFIASCIGKIIALGFSLITYYLLDKKENAELDGGNTQASNI